MDFKGILFNIMPINNIPSVLEHGILSKVKVRELKSKSISVAMEDVQQRRDGIKVPNGLMLHQYASLYFDPSNPMMYKNISKIDTLCVLVVSDEVLKLENVVVTDCNAACNLVRFYEPTQLDKIEFDKVYAHDWRHPNDLVAYHTHRYIKCAEVLIPNYVDPKYILQAHVANIEAEKLLLEKGFNKSILVSPEMFFC